MKRPYDYALKTQQDVINYWLAMPAKSYRVSIVPVGRTGGFQTQYDVPTFVNVETVRFLRAKNAEGCHVFARPLSTRYILIDDLCGADMKDIERDGIRPTCVIETSAKDGIPNYQVWVKVSDEELPIDVATSVSRELTRRYNGDKDSASAMHLGRLPGLRNRKEMYRDEKGGYPLVLLRRYSCRIAIAPVLTDILKEAIEECADVKSRPLPPSTRGGCGLNDQSTVNMTAEEGRAIYDHKRLELASQFAWPEFVVDRSKEDFAIAKSLTYDRMSNHEIAAVLFFGSDKARERGKSYIEATIEAATHL